MGGMDGFGAVIREAHEPVFHAPWERRMFALAIGLLGTRGFNVDEYRRTIERMPPADYLRATYYEKWLFACESLLIEKGILTRDELDSAYAAADASGSVAPPSSARDGAQTAAMPPKVAGKPARKRARFQVGDRVVARNLNPPGHTRLPRYARGHRGVIRHDHGVFVFPDTHAHGRGANPQHCYTVEFDARELWGSGHSPRERVMIDLWEDYLAPDAAAQQRRAPAKKPAAKRVTASRPVTMPGVKKKMRPVRRGGSR